ncbi:hypothetical protein P691DRAFT_813161 [Macrolepiota fuliginosa MF-IS2]|uniref:Uncharacterized protein n=1 Tax=Macrolepiota fuliginosa MF-IS2 TaxID=1400762 RepID=A0A9P6BV57_9AGAR|nr:hypothetical protein P691DRAFT_813161 [Macrolepiota fuliginosa MF-IS2]
MPRYTLIRSSSSNNTPLLLISAAQKSQHTKPLTASTPHTTNQLNPGLKYTTSPTSTRNIATRSNPLSAQYARLHIPWTGSRCHIWNAMPLMYFGYRTMLPHTAMYQGMKNNTLSAPPPTPQMVHLLLKSESSP